MGQLAIRRRSQGRHDERLRVLPGPVPRDGERILARWGLLGEGAQSVFTARCFATDNRALDIGAQCLISPKAG